MDFYLIATPMYILLLLITFYSLKHSIKEDIQQERKVICKIETKQYYRQHLKNKKNIVKISKWTILMYLLKNFTIFHLFTAKRKSRSEPLLFAYGLINIFLYYFIDFWPITLGFGVFVSLSIFAMQLTRNYKIQEIIKKSKYHKSDARPQLHSIVLKFVIFWIIKGILTIGMHIYLISLVFKNYSNIALKKQLTYFGIGILVQNLAIKPFAFFILSVFGSQYESLIHYVQKQNRINQTNSKVHIINDTQDININHQQNQETKHNIEINSKNFNIFQQVDNNFNSHTKLKDDQIQEAYKKDKDQQGGIDNYQKYIKRFDFSKIKQKTSKKAKDKQLTFFINWLDQNQVIRTEKNSYRSSNNFQPSNKLETTQTYAKTNYNSEPKLRNSKQKIKEIFQRTNNNQKKNQNNQSVFLEKETEIESKNIQSIQKISNIKKVKQPFKKTCFLKVQELNSQIKEVNQYQQQQQQSKRQDAILGKQNFDDKFRLKRKRRKTQVIQTDPFQKQKQNIIQIYLPTEQRYDFDKNLTGKYSCKSWGTQTLSKKLKKKQWTKNRDKPIVHQFKVQKKQFYL